MSWNQVSRIFHFLQILDYDRFNNRVFAKIIMNLPNNVVKVSNNRWSQVAVGHLGLGSNVQSLKN